MDEHSIFYYPYASFSEEQSLLLKAAALYFDKLYILDPSKASGAGGGGLERKNNEVRLLEEVGILVRVSPEEVMHKYEGEIELAIRRDMQDEGFVDLCQKESEAEYWQLALAKIPREIRDDPKYQPVDRSMQRMLGEVAREASSRLVRYDESYAEAIKSMDVYDESAYIQEYIEQEGDIVEYRYADYPVAIGESIMLNHALFGGLLHLSATALTDDIFHHKIFNHKANSVMEMPIVEEVLEDRIRQRALKRDALAMTALTDLDLAIISPEIDIVELLEYREDNKDILQETRGKLGWLAREIRESPWSQEFTDELEHKSIPALHRALEESRKARDAWLKSKRGKSVLKVAGIAVAAAATTITLISSPTPLIPIAALTGALTLVADAAVPSLEQWVEWREGKKKGFENGYHYFLNLKE